MKPLFSKLVQSLSYGKYIRARIFKIFSYLSIYQQHQKCNGQLKQCEEKLLELENQAKVETDKTKLETLQFRKSVLQVQRRCLAVNLMSSILLETCLLNSSLLGYAPHRILAAPSLPAIAWNTGMILIYFSASVCALLNYLTSESFQNWWTPSSLLESLTATVSVFLQIGLLVATIHGLAAPLALLNYKAVEPRQFPAITAKPHRNRLLLKEASKGLKKQISNPAPLRIEYHRRD